MKKIEVIIRNSQFDEVRSTLLELGIEFFTYSEVTGIGVEKRGDHFRATEMETKIIPRVNISFVCADKSYQSIVETIINVASLEENGDGRIYISSVDETVSIKMKEAVSN